MPIGVIINALSVLLGGLIGAFLGDKIPERVRKALPLTFGAASMAMGINLIMKMHTMPAVILALILGSAIGELIKLEKGIEWCAERVRKPVERIFSSKGNIDNQKEFMEKFVGIVVLFCASGTGIFGALNEGMTGDHSVLIAKSFLDFFTAAIFATALGYIVLTICIPQFIILIGLFLSAALILPMTTPAMVADFTACGGIIMLATGFRISGIKAFPIANMLPALVIVMPISHLWTNFVK
ncbi:hypothetical protein CPAST_c10830 [Clostridium pasteurianum DSM 525 = ATCC 6013]|uniref:Membrane protein YdfK n=1 Tax=Clostridium pasteurianum DSM 525 = ATCC 6013 TaxID=1262449 RepID=A0A0H3J5K7_CLOPA|nr:DUF554 domain-containing protein [Clostridium pasteurianum]AJA47183.1 hypothetical protein CPAST_c10830 [Clostridium pasteurianum DSM 525 = ATCC 6013]AJA51171.1 hypothetical protein CLPA_c10830 [Clostridium pasteurianum DSM 525 = ATCC 6013]AOZ74538.1 hypothetical protein AQ983_05240 [Clostridium pasteurianum DSM 525 = ATCC 6013]AOZ78335.1 hypothetical protein AQ984_05230 [Clostridium pasteurianum]ELP59432.1 hypothetical protein F502_09113 [Clostridium pasteurianum DSM 525 = ATCC 6013]